MGIEHVRAGTTVTCSRRPCAAHKVCLALVGRPHCLSEHVILVRAHEGIRNGMMR